MPKFDSTGEIDLPTAGGVIYYTKSALIRGSGRASIQNQLTFLYTNIGRGHPFYLDGIADVLLRRGQIGLLRRRTDVFEISHGLSLLGWKAVRRLYRLGASQGPVGKIYARLRRDGDYNRGGLAQRLLADDIRQTYQCDTDVLVVAHPSLVAMLAGKKDLVYQHGELVTPREAVALGAAFVLVPTEKVAEAFQKGGYSTDRIIITGLCVDPSLTGRAAENFENRQLRLSGQQPLTGAFFSSGAEPKAHINRLVQASLAAVEAGGKVILFTRKDGRFAEKAGTTFGHHGLEYEVIDSSSTIPADLGPATIVSYASRREEDIFTAKFFPFMDYFASPSHERTNWALGLGLAMFIVGPSFGPFSPLNRQLLLDAGVADRIDSIDDARTFGQRLVRLRRHGALQEMSRAGWGKRRIDGFEVAANFLAGICGASS